jgi:hypothetical protein
MMSHFPACACWLLLAAAAVGCSGEDQPDANRGPEKHNFKSDYSRDWTLDTWTNASRFPPGEQLEVWLRLTSERPSAQPSVSEMFVSLTNVKSGKVRFMYPKPAYREKRRDSLEVLDGDDGISRCLLPGPGWEMVLKDVFHVRNAADGDYVLNISVNLSRSNRRAPHTDRAVRISSRRSDSEGFTLQTRGSRVEVHRAAAD